MKESEIDYGIIWIESMCNDLKPAKYSIRKKNNAEVNRSAVPAGA